MIESILLVALGFLGAAFLALLAAPALWRRSVTLTRRRVEASMPVSRSEIQADRDRLRADFAMTARRLELDADALKKKMTGQRLELDRQRDELRSLRDERAARDERIGTLEAEIQEIEAQRQRLSGELDEATGKLGVTAGRSEKLASELDEMSRLYEEASYASSTRQINLVARESEIDRLADELGGLRKQRKEAERRVREAETAGKAAADSLEAERKRAADLDARVSRLTADLSDREDRIERREKELARLQEDIRSGTTRFDDVAGRLERIRITNGQLEEELERARAQVAALEQHERELVGLRREIRRHGKTANDATQLSEGQKTRIAELEKALERALDEVEALAGREKKAAQLQRDLVAQTKRTGELESELNAMRETTGTVPPANGRQPEEMPSDAGANRIVLESRIKALSRENRRLRAGLGSNGHAVSEGAGDAVLRESIDELAAQVVQLTALLDEPDSPLRKELAETTGKAAASSELSATSLADRVRALQKAAAQRVN